MKPSRDELIERVEDLVAEAARLRAALEEIVAEYTKGKDDADTAGYMAVIAGKALNEQDAAAPVVFKATLAAPKISHFASTCPHCGRGFSVRLE